MKAYFIIILGFFISLPSLGQEVKTFNVMFYNVENLFDTINDINKNDEASPIMEIKFNRSEIPSNKFSQYFYAI